MDFLTKDLRFAARALLRSRGFLLLVVGAIALGVGVNTTVFAVLNTLMLKPLPFPQPERLVWVDQQAPERGTGDWMSTSYPDFVDWRRQSTSFEQLAAFHDAAFDLSGTGDAERASGAVVTDNLFAALRVRPLLGRAFTPDEAGPGGAPVAVLGHGLWTRRFGGDRGVIGQTLLIDGQQHTIVGVMPEGFRFPEFAELWVPMRADPAQARRDLRNLAAVGRLKGGVDVEEARAEMATVNWRIAEANPQTNDGVTVTVTPLHETLRGDAGNAAVLFQGITLLVLLIAWANVANLLLVRAVGRAKEIAIRTALGAGRSRILRQLIAEGLVLAVLGGVIGVLLGAWGRNLIVGAIPIQLPFWIDFSFDWRVLAFAGGVSLVGVLFFALAPAVQMRRLDIQGALKAGSGRGGTADKRGGRLQSALVVAETALALVLLLSAGLMAKSLIRMQSVNPGFSADGVATARLSLSQTRYPDVDRQRALWGELLGRASALPGVESAAMVSALPLTGGSRGSGVQVDGRPTAEGREQPYALGNTVSGEYFRTLRIPVRQGRSFTGADRADAVPVAVVNETMAKRFWPGESPVGRRVKLAGDGQPWREVVGVVGDVKDSRLANPTWPTVYVPYTQASAGFARLVVRTRQGEAAQVIPGVRSVLREIDPSLPIDQTWTMHEVVGRSMWMSRLYAWLAGVFGVIALGLSAVGIYGLLGYMVRQRTQEIGIRAALGATPRDVVRLFVRRGVRLAAIAVAIGLPVGFAMTRLLSSLLFGMGASDAVIFVGVPVLMMAVALLASFAPARAATRVEPSIALRTD